MKRQLRRAFWAVGVITLVAVMLFLGVVLRRDVVEDQGHLKAILFSSRNSTRMKYSLYW